MLFFDSLVATFDNACKRERSTNYIKQAQSEARREQLKREAASAYDNAIASLLDDDDFQEHRAYLDFVDENELEYNSQHSIAAFNASDMIAR